jgi:hypothetical protein
MKLPKKKINEIAQDLDCGLICYIHKETHEHKTLIDFDLNYDAEEELWQDTIDEIENNRDKYIKLEPMSSRESFGIMEGFIDQVSKNNIRKRLIAALNKRKPFRHFKYEVDNDEEVRQHWFKYKEYRYEEWVINQLEV